ncbi:DUF5906 domain-containing protein [Xanthomonas campestris pv. campestris]|uniref:DUF5906 domain-containing protein n=1 Tax=Xanthomonas campestris TaxID=339 RepID=UPI002AD1F9C9|nr:DUF5906 domain-containing protein [Xanthomonas campestris]MEA0709488.1 DUF5906 domain-containing protein [Xanthomonas campestris pv. campestris]MEA0742659.1 DUF5906 domain-containing protein [Xanthomonas campestris pv. campestris]
MATTTAAPFKTYIESQYGDASSVLATYWPRVIAEAASHGLALPDHPPLIGNGWQQCRRDTGERGKSSFLVELDDGADVQLPLVQLNRFNTTGRIRLREWVWAEFEEARATGHRPEPITAERRAELQAEQAARQAEAFKRTERDQADAAEGERATAKLAATAWKSATPATDHPYLTRKGMDGSHGLRIAAFDLRARVYLRSERRWIDDALVVAAGDLLVPMTDAATGRLVNLQRFTDADTRKYLPGGRKTGCHWRIGGDGPAVLVEGVANAYAIHAATGEPAVAAFDAGNIPTVARLIGDGVRLVVADNDASGVGQRAAAETGLPWVMPPTAGQDVWDLWDAGQDVQKLLRSAAVSPAAAVANEDTTPAVAAIIATAIDNAAPAVRDDARREEQKRANAELQSENPADFQPRQWTLEEMVSRFVHVATGDAVADLMEPRRFWSWSDFRAATSGAVTFCPERRKPAQVAVQWKESMRRLSAHTRTFHAGAPMLTRDPDGLPAVNSWRPIERTPAKCDVALFVDHVRHLFGDDTEKFIDWLAHIEQKPGVLPHYGWLHIADKTGTGRNWLSGLFSRMWRGYVAPNVDLAAILDSQYNGDLAGRILAVVDEAQDSSGDRRYSHMQRLKSLVNADERAVNPKFGRQYREWNACRWLVFSNHMNALAMDDQDRRWQVAHHKAQPMPEAYYVRLYAALENPEFVNAVGVFLRDRDISAFNPGARPAMNAAKAAVIGAGKSIMQQRAEEVRDLWPSDVITNADLVALLDDNASEFKRGGITPAMRRCMEEIGAVSRNGLVKVGGTPSRCYILRNAEAWMQAAGVDVAREIQRPRSVPGMFEASAARVMAEVGADNDNEPDGPF